MGGEGGEGGRGGEGGGKGGGALVTVTEGGPSAPIWVRTPCGIRLGRAVANEVMAVNEFVATDA